MYARPVNFLKPPLASFTHEQPQPATTWNIKHGMNRVVSVTTLDASGEEFVGAVTHVDRNIVTINFNVAVAGRAIIT